MLSPACRSGACFIAFSSFLFTGVFSHAADLVRDDSTAGRVTITEENDKFGSHDDRHYTQGARLSYLSGPVMADGFWDQPFGFLSDMLPIFNSDSHKRKIDWTVAGQSLDTAFAA